MCATAVRLPFARAGARAYREDTLPHQDKSQEEADCCLHNSQCHAIQWIGLYRHFLYAQCQITRVKEIISFPLFRPSRTVSGPV